MKNNIKIYQNISKFMGIIYINIGLYTDLHRKTYKNTVFITGQKGRRPLRAEVVALKNNGQEI